MAKSEKKRPPAPMTRKHRSRIAQEQRQLRYIRLGVIAVMAIIILVLLAGLFKTQVADPAATRSAEEALESTSAVTVNGDMVSVADWQSRVRFERQLRINQIAQINQQLSLFDPSTELAQQFISQGQAQIQEISNSLDIGDGIATDVLDQMVEDQLVRQEAARSGVVITPDELQRYIEVDLFSYPYPPTPEPLPALPPPTLSPTDTVRPEPTLTPTIPPTPRSREDFEADYGNYIDQVRDITGMTEDQLRAMIAGDLYRSRLLEAFADEVETNVQQVKGRYIVMDDQETADALLARLEQGETFEDLEAEINADESEDPLARSGSFDWSPLEILLQRFGDEFAAAALNASADSYVQDVIRSFTDQLYLIFVEGNETRELPDYLIEQQRQDRFQSWLNEQKLAGGVVYGDWHPYVPREPTLP